MFQKELVLIARIQEITRKDPNFRWYHTMHGERRIFVSGDDRISTVVQPSKSENCKILDTLNILKNFIVIEKLSYFVFVSLPCQVLIVGGGDGGVAREVAKHPLVERIVQVEIDSKVLEVSRKYLPTMGVGLDHPKVTLNVGDGFQFLQRHSGEFDVIITDSSDPIGK